MNGREKKIAIVENERVTEFYIERGSEDQGIVGNLYKGRVMRVLPGMQSAFVDIGLERDAFLYVSDFFDEEAEFERIVVDTAKKGDAATAQLAAAEHIEQSRIERERHIEASHERAEPLRELESADITVVETSATPSATPSVTPEEEPSKESKEAEKRRRGRRGGRRSRPEKSEAPRAETEAIETPFISAAGSFERVSDDEERVANGEMLKDARLQERIMDEVHAREFDFDNLADARVGSLLPTAQATSASFERVDDGDSESGVRAGRSTEVVAAHVRDFADEVADESSRGLSFQRVSDDEELAAQRVEVVAPATRRATPKKEPASRKKTGVISRFFKTLKPEELPETETPAEAETSAEVVPDAEASITTGRAHEEFATRRGGRRRRRPSKKPTDTVEGNGAEGQAETIDAPEPIEAQAAPEVVAEAPAVAEETPAAAPREGRRPAPAEADARRGANTSNR